jgi:hypothetical protein
MEQNRNAQRAFTPGAATDEPASSFNSGSGETAAEGPSPPAPGAPVAEPEPDLSDAPADPRFATRRAEEIYWAGVRHGIRSAGREPGHPHMPRDFNLNLTRDSGSGSLVSARLVEAWPYAPDEATLGIDPHGVREGEDGGSAEDPPPPAGRNVRHDGWTDDRVRRFVETLAETGVVADACRAAGMSRDSAYAFRRRASGRAFALAWDAALLLSRSALGDDVLGRSRYGVVDKVYRNGELVAERHRYDNRLTMAVLTRLDRQAEGLGENAPVIRAVSQEWDRFLDLLPKGPRGAEEFLAARFPNRSKPFEEPEGVFGGKPQSGSESALLARLSLYEDYRAGLPTEIDTGDLDPDEMERWTKEQWQRAEVSGFVRRLAPLEWPAAARDPEADGTDGMCKLRKLYLVYHPPKRTPAAVEPEDDFAGCSVWEENGGWRTDFPPPDGFDGWEEGEPGDEDYRRELAEEELVACGEDDETVEEERTHRLAEQHAARRRFFFFEGDEASTQSPGLPASDRSAIGAAAEGAG